MSNDYFRFKQFTVKQESAAMKVGLDSVLLGAWVNVDHANTILDVGTGTGLLALMMAQRKSDAEINAVEIDPEACRQARENVESGPWPDRIRIINDDFRTFVCNCTSRYNLVICNPPFFVDSLKSSDIKCRLARHNDSLSYSDLITGTKKLLTAEGSLALVLPLKESRLLVSEARSHGFFIRRTLNIRTIPCKPVHRVFLELSRTVGRLDEKTICVERSDRQDYTDEYKELTKDFYLKF